jgi:hypothetical protein
MFLSALSNNVGTPVVIVAKKTMLAIFGLDRPTALDEYLEVSVALESGTEPGQAGESFSPRRDLLKGATAEWIRRELDGVADLQDIIRSTAGDLAGRYGSRKEVLAHIERLARPFYQSVWNECTPDEQLVLVQLAEEGAVNPKQQSAVQSLLQRRILRKDTELRIMNQSFALFASSVHDPQVVAKFEKSHSGTNWARTQRIIVVGIVLLLIFLVTTQPAAVETLTKYFSGVAASVIALITLANKLGGLKGNTR